MRGSTAGLADGVLYPQISFHAILLVLVDYAYASLVLAPAVVTYWRGTWNLMDDYLYPDNNFHSSLASLTVGVIGHLIFTIFQTKVEKCFSPQRHRITFYVMSRVYTFVYGAICVNGWRGMWHLLDSHTPNTRYFVLSSIVISAIALVSIRGLRNISAVPFVCITDAHPGYFSVPTMFKTSGSRDPLLYVLDCTFSVLVVGSLVVFVWRGLWVFFDLELFPHDPKLSAWGSTIIGYTVVGVTFTFQPLVKWTCDRLKGWWRILVADIFLFFSFIGTINVWRGVWKLLDVYFLPDNRVYSDWLTHVIGLVLLILLNCFNSVLVRGVYIDAEEPAGQCVIFPVYYVRLFFQKERTKKQKRLLETLGNKQDQQNNISLLEKIPLNNVHGTAAVQRQQLITEKPKQVEIVKMNAPRNNDDT